MYAVIDNHGKQYRVQAGDEIQVDLIAADEGELVQFDRVLVIGSEEKTVIGTPHVLGARVLAQILRHEKGPKLIMMRFQPEENKQARKGHRQKYTRIKIREIHPE
jgi:large subunit ribosomal protein L21